MAIYNIKMPASLCRHLSEEEKIKIDRFYPILKFLNRDEAIYWVATGPFRFDTKVDSFIDNINDKIICPTEKMINLFYMHLSSAAINKLKSEIKRSKIKGLQRLLIKSNKLDFLPIGL